MVDLNGQLRLHERFRIAAVRIGSEELPVLVIENFLSNPDILIDYATAHCAFDSVTDAFYPGSRAPVPPIYCYALRAFLGDFIREAFGLGNNLVSGELSHFSLVTTPPADLEVVRECPTSTTPTRGNWPCCIIFAGPETAVPPFTDTGGPASTVRVVASQQSGRKWRQACRHPGIPADNPYHHRRLPHRHASQPPGPPRRFAADRQRQVARR